MLTKGVTLRGLELFEILSNCGSIAQTAKITGLSQPTVSQQLSKLEAALNCTLIDHNKRPMRLTPAGQSFLSRAKIILSELRLAQTELTVMDLAHLTDLRIGLIDDFDNELTPRLATILADSLTKCKFKLLTYPSHMLNSMLAEGGLHVVISASPEHENPDLIRYPLLRDPFILVAPKTMIDSQQEILPQLNANSFLRYDQEQLIAGQIEGHLVAHGLELPHRFELGSHQTLMAMVARGIGWSITTPLGYMRGARFHDQVEAFALPFSPFAREISLYASADWAENVPLEIANTVQDLAKRHIIDPAVGGMPWLGDDFHLL